MTNLGWTKYIEDIDLSADEPWQPVFNPYTGSVTPCWKVTQEARMRMGDPPQDSGNR